MEHLGRDLRARLVNVAIQVSFDHEPVRRVRDAVIGSGDLTKRRPGGGGGRSPGGICATRRPCRQPGAYSGKLQAHSAWSPALSMVREAEPASAVSKAKRWPEGSRAAQRLSTRRTGTEVRFAAFG